MKADISRSTFRRTRHYSGVLLQQGRVQLDADFNEQGDIGRHRDRLTTRDVVGPSGAPAEGGGFRLTAAVLLEGIGFAGQDGVAVGQRGTRLTTSDGGATWAAADSGTKVDLHAVSVVDANNVWAVGSAAKIRKGTAAGNDWAAQSTPAGVSSELRGVHFRDASNGVAVGAGPVVLATANGGSTWAAQAVPAGVTESLNGVHFPTAGTGFAVGDAGRILTFSGGSWKTQSGPVGFAANLRAVRFASAQKGWAVGDGGAILSTTDGGTTWVERDAPLGVTGSLRAIELDPGNADVVWAAGDDATLVRSTDGGVKWSRVDAPAGVTADLRALAARPASVVAVAGDLSTLADVSAGGAWTVHTAPATARDLAITAGRFYVDGILCENDRALRYGDQPDYPAAPDGAGGTNLVYLDVWERHVTALEDSSLREVALGGPDTATRTKTVWQVRIADQTDIPAGGTCDSFPPDWVPPSRRSTGRLRARAEAAQIQTNECMVPVGGGYRRLENQLYRVEIHEPGTGAAATFKWSRDNGSVVARLEAIDPKSQSDFTTGELTVSEPGRDAVVGFAAATFVELGDEGRVLRGEPGILLEVDTITGNTIKWKNYAGAAFKLDGFGPLPTVRRWDGTGAVEVGAWKELEAGVFVELDGGDYRSGDYWTIPARTRTGTVEWHTEDGVPVFDSRHGIEHRYVPLGFAQLASDGTWTVTSDCRETFDPLTELATLVYVGGAGQEAMPGDPLPQPLEVGVFRGRRPIEGAHILFTADKNAHVGLDRSTLGAAGSEIQVVTSAAGVASCYWQLEADPGKPSQVVTAALTNDLGTVLGPEVTFDGRLSIAQQVAYVPDAACPDLQNAKTVQAAIDVLCKRPTGGGGCAVAVTPEERLDEVVKKLLEEGRTSLCLCLLPGDYTLPEGLMLSGVKAGLELTGCGRATRILAGGEVRLDGLPSVILRDLDVVLQTETPLAFTGCGDVDIESCQVTGQVKTACLVGGASRIRLSSNVLRAHVNRARLQLVPEIGQIVKLPNRGAAQKAAARLVESLADDRPRAVFTKKLSGQRGKLEALTPDEQAAYQTLFANLSADRQFAAGEVTAALLGIFDAATRAAAGIALAILDAGAETTLTDNELDGALCLYGAESETILNADQMKLIGNARREGRIGLDEAGQTLHLRDNRVTRVTYSEEMLRQLLEAVAGGGRADLAPAYRSIFASSNLVEGAGNQVLAQHVALTTNDFDAAHGLSTASVLARTATFVGNASRSDMQIFVAAESETDAANLAIVVMTM